MQDLYSAGFGKFERDAGFDYSGEVGFAKI